MSSQFQPVFKRLRDILENHARNFAISHDTPDHYGLEAPVGPETVRAWGGKVKSSTIPVAWVKSGKANVSYHLMGVYGNPKLLEECSEELRAHMQGKSCFNFKAVDETLFRELARLTARSLTGMEKLGTFLSNNPPNIIVRNLGLYSHQIQTTPAGVCGLVSPDGTVKCTILSEH